MPPTKERKKPSCTRCRYRKLKCSPKEPGPGPCSNCDSLGKECKYPESDVKRRPASRSYVAGLEERVARLESLFVKVKAATNLADVGVALNDANIDDNLSKLEPQAKLKAEPGSDSETKIAMANDYDITRTSRDSGYSSHLHIESEAGSLLCHGPTSIFHFPILPSPTNTAIKECCSISNPTASEADNMYMGHHSHVSEVVRYFGINMRETLVNCALEQFFKWQYPYFMFIYREAFLRDHFASQSEEHAQNQDRKYWSAPLLFAVCALGMLMTDDVGPSQREASERFFDASESLLLVTGIARPCIKTVQAFLCLAYYEIGRGNLSKGWGFSGVALRMAQDLGFQRDPHKWQLTDKSIVYTQEDMEVRRRIYWGCYISDKFISLLFGRPIFFYDDDAEVALMDRLPDYPSMAKWLPVGLDEAGSAHSKMRPLIPSFRAQIGLARVIQHILTKLYTANQNPEGFRRKTCIDALEFELSRWDSSLEESLKWNKWQPTSTFMIPNVAALHVLFYSLRIILNLERINMMGSFPISSHENSPRDICLSSAQDIMAILRKYRSQHGLQYSPLVFIYGAVRAAQVVASFGIPEELSYILQVLDECSGAWTLARDLGEKLRSLSQNRVSTRQQPVNLNTIKEDKDQ